MDNLFIESEKFSHKLNMTGFTNIEKSYTTEEFNQKFADDKFLVLEKSGIDAFIKKIGESTGGQIVKGGFNDTEEINGIIEKAKQSLQAMSRIYISDGPGTEKYVFVLEKSRNIETLEKSKEGEKLEKSHLDAFEYSDKIVFKKSGKDIKDKFSAIKIQLQAKLDTLSNEIQDNIDNCFISPTEKPSVYGMREMINIPYKVFNWNQTYFNTDHGMHDISESENSCNPCSSKEEAEINSKYNSLVYQWIDTNVELKTTDLYANNLEDKTMYELTARQMIALNF